MIGLMYSEDKYEKTMDFVLIKGYVIQRYKPHS